MILKTLAVLASAFLALAQLAPAAEVSADFSSTTSVPVTAASYTATGNSVNLTLNFVPPTGTNLTVVKNTGLDFINGTFDNLAQGQKVELPYGGITYEFAANYYGGSGNDLVLIWANNRAFAWGNNSRGQLGDTTTGSSPVPVAISTLTGVSALSGKTVVAVATGREHSLALCSDGTVAAWGLNDFGQLGDGSTTNRSAPVAINTAAGTSALAGKTVVAVAAGGSQSLALCSDGTVAAWGYNLYGQLGDGTTTNRSVPVAVNTAAGVSVLSGKTVVAVAAGAFHSLALCSDGTVAAWGANNNGQLGDNSGVARSVPVAVNTAAGVSALSGKTVVAVAAGGHHGLVLCADGTVAAWGYNSHGQLGDNTGTSRTVPVAVNKALGVSALSGKTVVAVKAGGSHSLALCSDGSVAAWGDNSSGQLGDSTKTLRSAPVAVNKAVGVSALSGKTVVAMAAGGEHSLALCSDGTAVAWGLNSICGTGNNSLPVCLVPVPVNTTPLAFGERFSRLMDGSYAYHSLAVVAVPYAPELCLTGNGAAISAGSAAPIVEKHTDFGSTAVGGGTVMRTFTIQNTGNLPLHLTGTPKVVVAGPQAADFTVTSQPVSPVAVGGSATFQVAFTPSAAWSRAATLSIASDDLGENPYDFAIQGAGIGVLNATFAAGGDVPLTASGFTATGSTVNLALHYAPATGTDLTVVRTTGSGFINGTFDNLAQGQQVALPYGGITYEFVANYYGGSGNDLVLAWANNRLIAWGSNSSGQLGDTTTADRSVPVAVNTAAEVSMLSGKMVRAVAASGSHSLALCADGTLVAWGSNGYGQLGDSTTTDRAVPVAVNTAAGVSALAGKTVVAVAAGSYHSLALCSDGSVAAWGSNSFGQLGDNTTTNRSVPVAVNTAAGVSALAGKTVTAISAGGSRNLALCSDGSVTAWGYNFNGGLGDATSTNRFVPVAVNTTSGVSALFGKIVVAVAAGGGHSLALCSDGSLAAWGDNSYGQLGNNDSYPARFVPVAVNRTAGVSALSGKTVVAVAAGGGHSLALCSDGSVAAWGYNSGGQLGNASRFESYAPVAVSTGAGTSALSGKTVMSVSAGSSHSLALCSDDAPTAWGYNNYGQLGDGTKTNRSEPVFVNIPVLVFGERCTRIVSGPGASHTLALVAVPYAPDITLTGNGATIPDGSAFPSVANHTDFGSTAEGGGTVTRTFTIRNTGNLPLNLTGTPKVVVSGTHAADFTVTSQPVTPVAVGGSTTFQIAFTPGAAWWRTATLSIASDDPDENPFEFAILGNGLGVLNATYAASDQVPFTGSGFTAVGSSVNFSLTHAPATGTELMVVRNTGIGFIDGTFDNLAQGQKVDLAFGGITYEFVANYYGGNGNDLVLVWANNRAFAWGWNVYGQLGDTPTASRSVPVAVNAAAGVSALSGKTVMTMAAGSFLSLALSSDSTLAAWGSNANGRLGDSTTTDRFVPGAVNTSAGVSALSGKAVVAVAAGQSHSLALCSDGTVAAWGYNYYGQLGSATGKEYSSVPVAVNTTAGVSVLAGKTVVAVAVGVYHSLALCSDGTVAAWGGNYSGQLGDTTTVDRSRPMAVNTAAGVSALAGKSVVAVAAGDTHSLALCSDGTVAAWGGNYSGQLGDGTTTSRSVPVAVNTVAGTSALSGRTVVAVAAGREHSLALCSNGTVAAWGNNEYGQLGDGTTVTRSAPVAVSASGVSALTGKAVVAVTGGGDHNLALCSNGRVAAWGNNGSGQLGDGSTTNRSVPVVVTMASLSFGERFTRILGGSGANHSLALVAVPYAPEMYLAGNGSSIPDGSTLTSFANLTDFGSAAAGGGSVTRTFTIHNNGNIPLHLTGTPKVAVSGAHAADFTVTSQPDSSVPAGGSTTFEITYAPGAIWPRSATLSIASDDPDESPYDFAIGGNGTGVLSATYSTGSEVPLTINGPLIATGSTVNLSLNFAPPTGTNLTVVNFTGLGPIHGTFDNLAQWQKVGLTYGGITYEFIANYYGGTGNDLVLVWANRRVYAWGWNVSGQLGDNTTTSRSAPVVVNTDAGVSALADKTVVAMAGGNAHSLALCSDGSVVAWGHNSYGQLGEGSTTNRSLPVAVNTDAGNSALSGKTVVAVASGASHCLALCSDGTVAAWGNNYSGQLGDNTTINRSVPVAVNAIAGVSALAGKKVMAVAAGQNHSLALCTDGTVAAWGYNNAGQIGTNSYTYPAVPVAVNTATGVSALAGKTVVAVAAGQLHSLALCADGTVAAWGSNSSGQLGDNTTTSRYAPVAVNSVTGVSALAGKAVVALAAGGDHSLALCSDGSLVTWGSNAYRQLGDNTMTDRTVPVAVHQAEGVSALFGKTVVSMSAGLQFSLAVCSDRTLVAWGYNYSGQLGDATTTHRAVPVAVDTTSLAFWERFIQVAGGSSVSHTLALAAVPYAPNINLTGNGAAIPDGSTRPAAANHTDLGGAAAGGGTVTRTFTIQNHGNIPLNLTGTPNVVIGGVHAADFTVTSQPGSPVVAAGASTDFQIAFTPSAPWMRTATVSIASDDPDEHPYDFAIQGNGTSALNVAFSAGGEVPLTIDGLTATGSTIHFSLNFAPPTGSNLTVVNNTGSGFINGTFDNLAQGQKVELPYGGITYEFVANYYGGSGNDLVLVWANKRAYAWGSNSSGQIGDNTTTNRAMPVLVNMAAGGSVLTNKTVVAVTAGGSHSLALCSDGTVAAWGENGYGQLGDNTTTDRSVPVAVNTAAGVSALAGKTVVAVAAGDSHSLALCSDGTVAAWGYNYNGQLGDKSSVDRSVPVAVNTAAGVSALFGKSVVAVTAGRSHSLALCADGTVATWGHNGYGQLGDNSTSWRSAPVAVNTAAGVSALAGKTVVALAAGFNHSLALCADGVVATWGLNESGQLGDNTLTNRSVPVAVNTDAGVSALSGKTVVAVAAGRLHCLALCSDGSAATWGSNSYGQLGEGTTTSRPVPVAVNSSTGVSALSGKTVVEVAAGGYHNLALCSDGTLAAWGYNPSGQLGDTSTTNRSMPVAVSTTSLAFGERIIRLMHTGLGNSHTLTLTAVPYAPDHHLTGNGASIASGSDSPSLANHTDFGSTTVGGGPITRTFTIQNAGNLPLWLTGTPAVEIAGAHAADFTVTTQPVSSVAAGDSATFQVTFSPSAPWMRTATVRIASDDPDENPYEFVIQGTSTSTLNASFATASEVPLTTRGFMATGSTVNFTLNHAPATGSELMVVHNTGREFIGGRFDNLAQGQQVALSYGGLLFNFVADYYGGSGNDLVLVWANQRPYAWGSNSYGQLGNHTWAYQPVAVAVDTTPEISALAGKTVVAVAPGGTHTLALCSDGTLAAWGDNSQGQLGDGTTLSRSVPVRVNKDAGISALAGKTVIAVAAGYLHSLALCSDGSVAAWGSNTSGQLGDTSTLRRILPVAVNMAAGVSALAGKTVAAVAAGSYHNLALCSDGTLVSWGSNSSGQLGITMFSNRSVPTAVNRTSGTSALFGKLVVAVAAGDAHSLALCSDGTVAAWGANFYGQLGTNATQDRWVPFAVNTAAGVSVLAGKSVAAVAAGGAHSLALCTDGTVAAWGDNSRGQLGDNTLVNRSVPVAVNKAAGVSALVKKTVVAVAAGGAHSLARCSDGTLASWGSNDRGMLGDDTITNRTVPVVVNTVAAVSALAGKTVTAALAGYTHSLALCSDGTVASWGSNSSSQIGNNTMSYATAPEPVNSVTGISALAGKTMLSGMTGESHSLARCLDGSVIAWGRNSRGQLGDGTTTDRSVPVAVDMTVGTSALAGKTVVAVAAGTSHSLALCADGTVAAWGENASGLLGDNSLTNRAVPVAVNTAAGISALYGKSVVAVAAGTYHSLALCSDGTVVAWGSNSSGQLGDNASSYHSVPVAVNAVAGISALSGKSVVAIAVGRSHNLALCSDGTVAAWGYNYSGQLGDATTMNRSVPVAVNTDTGVSALAGKTVVAVAAGVAHSLAFCSDGTVVGWGSNNYGQLGDGTTTNRTVPTAVSTVPDVSALAGKTVLAVNAGESYSLAFCSDGTAVGWGRNNLGQLGDGTAIDRSLPVLVDSAPLAFGERFTRLIGGSGSSHTLALAAIPLPALPTWRLAHFGSGVDSGDGADLNDFDQDGLPNLLEFAFDLDPKHNSAGQIPAPQWVGGDFVISFTQPAGVSGISYGAEWSETLEPGSWTAVPDTGNPGASPPQHTFGVPVGPKSGVYLRLKVTSP